MRPLDGGRVDDVCVWRRSGEGMRKAGGLIGTAAGRDPTRDFPRRRRVPEMSSVIAGSAPSPRLLIIIAGHRHIRRRLFSPLSLLPAARGVRETPFPRPLLVRALDSRDIRRVSETKQTSQSGLLPRIVSTAA